MQREITTNDKTAIVMVFIFSRSGQRKFRKKIKSVKLSNIYAH